MACRRSLGTFIVLFSITMYPLRSSWAQLHPANAMGVTMGQVHYYVRDVEANKKFWIALGGAAGKKLNEMEVVKFPGVVILLSHGEPSGGTAGSVINHIGFRVPSVAKSFADMKTEGYKTEPNENHVTGNVYTPDGEKIELLEALSSNVHVTLDAGRTDFEAERNNRKATVPIELHHIHYNVPEKAVPEVKAWYVRTFGAVPSHRFHYEVADVPGGELDILGVPAVQAPTKGRMLDHIGFEVRNLAAFCKKLEASGIKLDKPYEKQLFGVAIASLTDPWGVSIELSEGLDHL